MDKNNSFVFVDAHIHIHDIFDLEKFFNSADRNFSQIAKNFKTEFSQGLLCLTESQGTNVFSHLKKMIETESKLGNWDITNTQNSNTILLSKNDKQIFLLAGRQIVTKENLEVLGLGLEEEFIDGNSIDETIDYVMKKKAIPVIPWGFGKWTGNRKKIVYDLILRKKGIFVGDNGNRPWFMKLSSYFETALQNNIFNLPGSDPLPFEREVNKPGSFGFVLNNILDKDYPFDSLLQILEKNSTQLKIYGKLESLFFFFKNQFAMQIVKRTRK